MKIKDFKVKNYKGFGDYEENQGNRLPGLSTFNMIYGNNNSGKSNILKFIDTVFSKKRTSQTVTVEDEVIERITEGSFWSGTIENQPYIFYNNLKEHKIEFSFCLEVDDEELKEYNENLFLLLERDIKGKSNHKYYTLKFDGQIVNYGDEYDSVMELLNVSLNGIVIYDKTDSGFFLTVDSKSELHGSEQHFESLLNIFEDNVAFIDTDRSFRTEKADSDNFTLTSSSYKTWLHRLYLDPFRYKKFIKITDFIRSSSIAKKIPLLKSFLPSFSVDKGVLELMLEIDNERYPISSFGTSIQQFLFLITILCQTKSKIILIEELELNLSPENQREFLKLLQDMVDKKLISQVIFTTHSNNFNKRNNFSIYQVEYDTNEKRSKIEKVSRKSAGFFRSVTID